MINKELDDIMQEYIKNSNDFCTDYEKSVLSKEHNVFSRELEKIYNNLESELWRLKHNTEELMYISNDRFTCREINVNMDEVKNEIDRVQHDLNTMHKYYLCRYGANIAKGLAKEWSDEADEHAFEIMKSAVKSIIKAGVENGD